MGLSTELSSGASVVHLVPSLQLLSNFLHSVFFQPHSAFRVLSSDGKVDKSPRLLIIASIILYSSIKSPHITSSLNLAGLIFTICPFTGTFITTSHQFPSQELSFLCLLAGQAGTYQGMHSQQGHTFTWISPVHWF